MKTKLILIYLLTQSFIALAQRDRLKYDPYFDKDQLSFSLISSQWQQPQKIANASLLSRGINLNMMYPIIGNRSQVAFAAGFGLACQNYYTKSMIQYNGDSIWFTPIPDSLDSKKYKLSTTYLTFPIEIRFRTNKNESNKSFKIYGGFRGGIMINNHTKYEGRDPQNNNEKIKTKTFYVKHFNLIDYGPTLRIGYGKFMVNGYYSLSSLFAKGEGPELIPFEFGFSIILF